MFPSVHRHCFGGADHRTLFILAHHELFAVKVRGKE